MQWTAPNYRLADAYINNTVDEKKEKTNPDPNAQSFRFNGNNLRGDDIDFRNQIREIMNQADYGIVKTEPGETLIDKIDAKNDNYVQDQFNEQKRKIIADRQNAERRTLEDNSNVNPYANNPYINPYNPYANKPPPAPATVQTYVIKSCICPSDSILTITAVVIVIIGLCFFIIYGMLSIERNPKGKYGMNSSRGEGDMNIDEPIDA